MLYVHDIFEVVMIQNNKAYSGWPIRMVKNLRWLTFWMFRHPAWAVGSYSSGPPTAGAVATKSTGGFNHPNGSPCKCAINVDLKCLKRNAWRPSLQIDFRSETLCHSASTTLPPSLPPSSPSPNRKSWSNHDSGFLGRSIRRHFLIYSQVFDACFTSGSICSTRK